MKECDLNEFEYAHGNRKIKLSKATKNSVASYIPTAAPIAPQNLTSPNTNQTSNTQDHDEVIDGHVVDSPMVGTAYMAPSPDADTFVKMGDQVNKGDTLMIIEAMKVMNQIKAPVAGEIVKILVENEEPVEFGQHLIIIKE